MALFGTVEDLIGQVRPGTRLAQGLAYLGDYRAGRLPQIEALARNQNVGDSTRVDINGAKLFVIVQCYAPRAREQSRFEAHQRYTDLQYLCEGQEWVELCDLKVQSGLPDFDSNGNVFFPFSTDPYTRIRLQAGYVAVLFPRDAHAPCLRVDAADNLVRKLVIKVQDAEVTDAR